MGPLSNRLAPLALLVLAGSWMTASSAAGNDAAVATLEDKRMELQARIDRLIEQLGAPSYATRERAHADLTRVGFAAFDALYEAQEHDDVEIAQRAKYLLRSMQIEWSREDDSPTVQSILRNYSRLGADDRLSRMDQLAGLEDGEGVEALCRIVRFEMSLRMSKEAAVRLITQPMPTRRETIDRQIRTIRENMVLSRRPSAGWLLTYAATLEDPASTLDRWDQLVKQEHEAYSLLPDRSRREIVRDLLQFQADLLVQLGRQEEASAAMVRWVDYGEGSRTELLEAVDWLVSRQAWDVVNDLVARHAAVFDSDAELLYFAADAYRKQGKSKRAEETAGRAAALASDDAKQHARLGSVLRDRGLRQWAEREYRRAIAASPANSMVAIQAHLNLSEMLHDVGTDLQAAETLKQFVDLLEKEPAVAQQLQGYRDPGSIIARMHFFFATHYHGQGDYKREKEHLTEAVARDSMDADVLIAMHRLPEQDELWQASTRQRIVAATEDVQQRIVRLKQYLRKTEGGGDPTEQKTIKDYLSISYNEYAWLVGNTEGDLDQAIRLSHKSLELRPNYGGYLDTLAHCYYTRKDYASAVKYQRKAVAAEPHSGQIARALERFEASLNNPD